MTGHHRKHGSHFTVVREVGLTIGAISGVVCMAAAIAAALFGVTPLVFKSGSMAPAIETGALALARTVPAQDVRVGDIVTVERAGGDRLTHRVLEVQTPTENAATFVLKGDANEFADSQPYVVSEVERVFAHVGGIGRAIDWLSSPAAIFLGGLLAGALVFVAWKPEDSRRTPARGDGSRTSQSPTMIVTALLMTSVIAVSVVNAPHAVAAPLTDSLSATSDTLTTRAGAPAPGSLQCRDVSTGFLGTTRAVELNWTYNDAGATYTYTLRRAGASDIVRPATTSASGGRVRVVIENGALISIGGQALDGVYTAFVTATIGGVTSPPSATQTITMSRGLFGATPSARCGGVAALSARVAPQPETSFSPSATSTTVEPTSPNQSTPSSTTQPSTTAAPSATTTASTNSNEVTPRPEATTSSDTASEPTQAQTSPSGSVVARIVDDGTAETLVVEDSLGSVLYRGPAPGDSTPIVWADNDSLWFESAGGFSRLAADTGWTLESVPVDDASVPPDITAAFG